LFFLVPDQGPTKAPRSIWWYSCH